MKVNKLDHICIAVRSLEAARKVWEPILDRKSTRLNSSHIQKSRMPSSA